MEITTKECLAWAAGFIDGEGCFGLHVTKGRRTDQRKYAQPWLSAAQCDRKVLDSLQKALSIGTVKGPYKKKQKNWNESYLFYATGFEKVQYVLAQVWPWLSEVKRNQAKKALLDYKEFNDRPKLKMGPKPRIPICHPDLKHGALGLCEKCYCKQYNQRKKNEK